VAGRVPVAVGMKVPRERRHAITSLDVLDILVILFLGSVVIAILMR
jgi:hypothetical protein